LPRQIPEKNNRSAERPNRYNRGQRADAAFGRRCLDVPNYARYNSWEDFATGEKNSVAQTTKKDSPWYRLRDHTDFHTDALTDRIAP
jgi:hypothetical protein